MTAPFDPYHKWLGIPPQEQPPNHYRLLGIAVFESDADVIANAADGRMVQLKSYQSGKHSAHSQRLLNEIATAKVCLLSAAKKAEYDSQLRKQSSAKAAAATPAIPTAVPVGDSSEIHMPEFARVHASSYLPRKAEGVAVDRSAGIDRRSRAVHRLPGFLDASERGRSGRRARRDSPREPGEAGAA